MGGGGTAHYSPRARAANTHSPPLPLHPDPCITPYAARSLRAAAPLAERSRVNANYAVNTQHNGAVPKWRYDVTEWLIEVRGAGASCHPQLLPPTASSALRSSSHTRRPLPSPPTPLIPVPQVGKAYRFHFETVSVTVNLFDRVLSQAFVPAELMQGSALACMFLASKLHERRPLALRNISSLAGMTDPQGTVRDLEMKILCLLRYDVNAFTVANCLAVVASCFSGPAKEAFRELSVALAHLALKSE